MAKNSRGFLLVPNLKKWHQKVSYLDTQVWLCLHPYWKKLMLSALKASIFHAFFQHWKWNAFSLILPYFFMVFFWPTVKTLQIQIWAGNAEYFKHVKIHRIIFDILWMKSQFQPDFTNNFFTRDWIVFSILIICLNWNGASLSNSWAFPGTIHTSYGPQMSSLMR